jgi:hypothetical protein
MKFRIHHVRVNPFTPSILALAALVAPARAQVASVVKLLSSANPVVQAQSGTLTAGVNWTATAAPTGTITLTDTVLCPGAGSATVAVLGAITLGSATSATPGAGTLAFSSFPCVGANSIVASYSGDANYAPGASQPLIETVLAQFTPATTTLSSSLNPSTMGQTVTFTAQLRYTVAQGAYPTGTVTFVDTNTGNVLGTGNVETSGTGEGVVTIASFTTSSLAPGTYALQAAYSGNNIYGPGTSQIVNQVVQQAAVNATSISLAASIGQVIVGWPVTLTAVVSSASGIPGGAVSFSDGAALLATVNLDATGRAALTTSSLAVGPHAITAAYGGGASFAMSASAPAYVAVDSASQAPTVTTLSSSANPVAAGGSVALAATVAAASSGVPTGTVTFEDASSLPPVVLGTAALANGVATWNATLSAGIHPLFASYSGDGSFGASVGTFAEVVNNASLPATATAIGSSANPSTYGQAVTFTVSVSGSGAAPTGSVIFNAGSISATVSLSGAGTAVFTTSALPAGSVSVSAAYSGDAANAGSVSPLLGQTVSPAATITMVRASPDAPRAGDPITFTATVAVSAPGSGTPTGTIAFVADGSDTLCVPVAIHPNGTATCVTSALAEGSHSIAVAYSGDANFTGSNGQASQTVVRGRIGLR